MTGDGETDVGEDATCPPERRETDIVAAIDRTGRVSEYIIADISRDDAWVSVSEAEVLPLDTWR